MRVERIRTYSLGTNEVEATVSVSGRRLVGLPIVNGYHGASAVVKLAGVEAAIEPRPSQTTLSGLCGGDEKSEDSEGVGSDHGGNESKDREGLKKRLGCTSEARGLLYESHNCG